MSKNGVNIPITTTADTSGIKRTEDALDALGSDTVAFTSDVRRAEDSLDRLNYTANQSSKAEKNLASNTKDSANAMKQKKKETDEAAKSSKTLTMQVQNASFQMADFAVQVGSGTGVMRAMSQQLPQLLGGFGMWGAVAGAAVAVIGGVMTALDGSSKSAENLEKRAEKVKDVAEQTAKNVKAMTEEDLKNSAAAVDLNLTKTDALKQSWDDTRKASQAYAESTLSNAEKIATAQGKISVLLNQELDARKRLQDAQSLEREKLEMKRDTQISDERQKVIQASDAINAAQALLQAEEEKLRIAKNRVITEEAALVAIRQQTEELQKQAKETEIRQIYSPEGTATYMAYPTAKAKEAKERLNSMDLPAMTAAAEAATDAAREAVKALTGENSKIQQAEAAVTKAVTEAEDIRRAFEINVRRINDAFAADALLQQVNQIGDSSEKLATEIREFAGKVSSSNQEVIAAKATIEAAGSDGKIAANETAQVGQALTVLLGNISTNQTAYLGSISQAITQMEQFQTQLQDLTRQMGQLRESQIGIDSKIKSIGTRKK